ncbi:MAG: hypothetical protein V3R66_03765, partial [Rhodospirillales bacterium]
ALEYFQLAAENASIGSLPRFMLYLGGALFALPWALWRLREEWGNGGFWAWSLAAAAVAVHVALAAAWVRWGVYAGIFISVILGDAIARADRLISSRLSGAARSFVMVAAISTLAIGPAAVGIATMAAGPQKGADRPVCDMRAMAGFLNSPPWRGQSLIIAASADFGPQILYRTPHRVLATFHHRNGEGLVDSVKILKGGDGASVKALIRKRHVDLVLICPGSVSDSYFVKDAPPGSLYERLESGDPPPWASQVSLPENPESGFRLFDVSQAR